MLVACSLQDYVPCNARSATTRYDYETYQPPYAKIEKAVHANSFRSDNTVRDKQICVHTQQYPLLPHFLCYSLMKVQTTKSFTDSYL